MRRVVGYVAVGVAAVFVWPIALINVLFPLALPVVVVLELGVMAGAIHAYAIPSSAMEPTLHCSKPSVGCESDRRDRILTLSWGASYGRGDIVAFETPPEAIAKCGAGGTFVKRIVGLPGESLQLRLVRSREFVYINGRKLDEPYVQPARRAFGPEQTWEIPKSSYFVMGDNRSQSCDSTEWGPVARDNLIGKVFMTYWPPQRISFR